VIERRRPQAIALAVAAAACLAVAPAGAAETADAFYAGKTIRLLVGFAPGGGYDLYARTLGRFLGRHLPGEPAVIVQNMPGAGSLKVVNYLFNAAPRDGTTLATFARGIVYEPILGHPEGAQFEAPKFNWIGSIANEVSVCAFNAPRGIATWQDMTTKKTLIGA
jgi:tripartite-type tricarboxylate transporter receptor subunit TctC